MHENREFPRLHEKWELIYRIFDNGQIKDPIPRYTLNIGGGGIAFSASEEIKPDTIIALELKSSPLPSTILALAQVVWCKRTRQLYEVGAEFWWIGWQNNDAQQAIANYIATVTVESGTQQARH